MKLRLAVTSLVTGWIYRSEMGNYNHASMCWYPGVLPVFLVTTQQLNAARDWRRICSV